MRVCVRERERERVCVCEREEKGHMERNAHTPTHIYAHMHEKIYRITLVPHH